MNSTNNYMRLKSGSDIRGRAIATDEGGVELTSEAVGAISAAFAVWLKNKTGKTNPVIALGRDSRISGPRIAEECREEFFKSGCTVLDGGLMSTPAMFMMTQFKETDADASLMITASHHPFDKNGLKFFIKSGGLEGSDISEILTLAASGAKSYSVGGRIDRGDYLELYCTHLVDIVRKETGERLPLKKLRLAVDAGNGCGGFYADRILKELGADTSGSQFLEPDGHFPNHVPNPENKQAMQSICSRTVETGADLGIIFDTDVDRAGAVGADGTEFNRNRLIALISAILLKDKKGGVIVTDSVTSDGLKDFIARCGGRQHRFKRGYKNVINECIRLNKEGIFSPLAIETSGHAAFKDNYYLDDGAYLVTRLIIELSKLSREGKNLSELIRDLRNPAEEAEIRMNITSVDFKAAGNAALKKLEAFAVSRGYIIADDSCEGIKITLPGFEGWVLFRLSVHDPVMIANIESYKAGGAKAVAAAFKDTVAQLDGIEAKNFDKYLQ